MSENEANRASPGEPSSAEMNAQACRALHGRRMTRGGGHPQELVQDRPGGVPGVRTTALAIEPAPQGGMPRGIGVCRVDQEVGATTGTRYRPSMA